MSDKKRVSDYFSFTVNYFNNRPKLTTAVAVVVVLDFLWLWYASLDWGYGVVSYLVWYPMEGLSIIGVGIIVIWLLIKKID